MMTTSARLAGSQQALIDARLDTIDRLLMGRVPRRDRLEIVAEVEAQLDELLGDRDPDELTRDDVLAVLGRLDPPDADEEEPAGPVAPRRVGVPAGRGRDRRAEVRLARVAGALGLAAVGLVLALPMLLVLADLVSSEILIIGGWLGTTALMFFGGIVAVALGVHARKGGAWAVVGIVAGIAAILASLGGTVVLLLLL